MYACEAGRFAWPAEVVLALQYALCAWRVLTRGHQRGALRAQVGLILYWRFEEATVTKQPGRVNPYDGAVVRDLGTGGVDHPGVCSVRAVWLRPDCTGCAGDVECAPVRPVRSGSHQHLVRTQRWRPSITSEARRGRPGRGRWLCWGRVS